jgi:hypothetical protein
VFEYGMGNLPRLLGAGISDTLAAELVGSGIAASALSVVTTSGRQPWRPAASSWRSKAQRETAATRAITPSINTVAVGPIRLIATPSRREDLARSVGR